MRTDEMTRYARGIGSLMAVSLAHAGLAVSLGLFYTVTYYGRAAVPLPYPAALLSPFFYYLSLNSRMSAEAQAAWWVLSFVVAGWVWIGTLRAWARRVGLSVNVGSVSFSVALGAVPLLLPAPWVGWALAQTPAGASWEQFIAACLRREFTGAPVALTPVYFTAALVALAVEVALLRRHAACPLRRVLLWIGASLAVAAALTALLAAGVGVLAARWG
jgi:hypothetical protein